MVERATENSSASSALVCWPARHSSTRCASCAGLSLGCLPRSLPLALATFMPSRVRILIRSDSNSAIIARTLNSSRPTGSSGSWSDPPMFSFTPALVSSPAVHRSGYGPVAGVGEGAGEPVEFGDHEGVAGPAGGQRFPEPGPGPAGPRQAVVGVDAGRLHAERGKCVALGGEVLGVGGAAGVSDEHAGHRTTVAVELPSPGIFAGGCCGNRRCPASWHCTISEPPAPVPAGGSAIGTSAAWSWHVEPRQPAHGRSLLSWRADLTKITNLAATGAVGCVTWARHGRGERFGEWRWLERCAGGRGPARR